MTSQANLEQLGSSDRWFYNAVITNTGAGDIPPVPARFTEQRTVPLIGNCADYYVTVARLGISGPTRNFPILAPALAQLTAPGTPPLIYTDYYVGVRFTMFVQSANPANPGSKWFEPIGYSAINLAQLILPSENLAGKYTTADGDFYHVYSAHVMVDALNSAISRATSYWGAGSTLNPIAVDAGFTFAPAWTGTPQPPVTWTPVPGCESTHSLLPPLEARMDEGFILSLRAPVSHVKTSNGNPSHVYNHFIAPAEANTDNITAYDPLPGPPARPVFFQAHLFFNDKLAELLPMPTVPPYLSTAPAIAAVGNAMNLFANPFLQRAETSVTTDPAWMTQIAQYLAQPWVDYTMVAVPTSPARLTSPVFGMYPIATYATRAKFETQPCYATSILTANFGAEPTHLYAATYAVWSQEYTTQSTWSVYDGLAITSNTLPAYEEAYGINVTNMDTSAPASATADTVNIVFDLDLNQDRLHQVQEGVFYAPSVYRYAKMKPGALSNMDMQVWLRRRDGSFVPWMIDSSGTISIKLMFTKTPY